MPENIPLAPTAPTAPANGNAATAAPNPKPKPIGPFNKAQLASISKTEQICAIALKPEYLPALQNDLPPEDGGLDKAIIQNLATACATARTTSGQAVDATTDKEDETVDEHGDAAQLLGQLRFVQARARQKHHGKNNKALVDYGIGSDLLESRAALEGWAQTIYDKTGTDTLPNVDPAKRAEILAALTAYAAQQTKQTSAQSKATSLRSQRDQLLDDLVAGRMKIQFAADAAWPWTDDANHATRMEFQIPASRPFVG